MPTVSQELGKLIGSAISSQSNIKNDLVADDVSGAIGTQASGSIILPTDCTVASLLIATDSFVLDHPVYGELDSAVLKLDGGYSGSPTVLYTTNF